MAAQAETALNMFHTLDRYVALQPEKRFGRAETLAGNYDLALQAFTGPKSLSGDAIQSFAAEILGGAFNRKFAGLPEQTHLPMHCNALAFAAITR